MGKQECVSGACVHACMYTIVYRLKQVHKWLKPHVLKAKKKCALIAKNTCAKGKKHALMAKTICAKG